MQRKGHGRFDRELARFFQKVGHAAAFAVFKRDEETALRITHITQLHDIAMPQNFRVGGLAHEKIAQPLIGGDVRQHHFEGHLFTCLVVDRQVNRAHAAVAQFPVDAVAAQPLQARRPRLRETQKTTGRLFRVIGRLGWLFRDGERGQSAGPPCAARWSL